MSSLIPRSIPVARPRLAATVAVPLREGGVGAVPFPPDVSVSGDTALVCSGVDSDGTTEYAYRRTLAAFDVRSGEERFTVAVAHGRKDAPPPDQVSAPGVAADGQIAQLLRRGTVVSLLVTDPDNAHAIREVEPSVAQLARAEEAVLSQPVPGPGRTWVVSWGLRNPDPRRLRTHRTECLRSEGGPPLWWADDERVLGAVEGIAITRAMTEGMVGHVIGRRIGTGIPAWESDIVAGSRVEMVGELALVFDRTRRAKERARRRNDFDRTRIERIANDPVGSRGVDWAAEAIAAFRQEGRMPGGPVRAIDAASGRVRFRAEVPGDAVGAVAGGPHVVCATLVDEEGVGGIFRYRAADGTELGRRGFHVDELYYASPPVASDEFPELIAVDHTHLVWLDRRRELVCEVLADPGREVWRVPFDAPVHRATCFAVSGGRIFVRDPRTLRILSEDG